MDAISIVMLIFSILGAVDCILNNRFGLGKEWERGFHMLGIMALTMVGMLVLAPSIAYYLEPLLSANGEKMWFEPSIVASSLLANDMGGATLSLALAQNEKIGYFNGLIVASMMGCTLSYTLPLALGTVEKRQYRSVLLGLMCGIVTIPIGCSVSGLMIGISLMDVLIDLLPIMVLAVLLTIGLLKVPEVCMKVFRGLGVVIKIMITVGLMIGIITFMTGHEILPYAAPIEEGAQIIFNAAIVISGAFPLMYVLGKILKKPMGAFAKVVGINETSAIGLLGSLASATPTYAMMKNMDDKGTVFNAAFSVSGAFVFASHLAYTVAVNAEYVPSMIVGKLISGVSAVVVAWLLYPILNKNKGGCRS